MTLHYADTAASSHYPSPNRLYPKPGIRTTTNIWCLYPPGSHANRYCSTPPWEALNIEPKNSHCNPRSIVTHRYRTWAQGLWTESSNPPTIQQAIHIERQIFNSANLHQNNGYTLNLEALCLQPPETSTSHWYWTLTHQKGIISCTTLLWRASWMLHLSPGTLHRHRGVIRSAPY